MARTKEYDREEALDKAMSLFWTHGYSAVSIQQLCTAMNMNRSSIYEEFGNKRKLFSESLSHYSRFIESWTRKIREEEIPEEAVRNFFIDNFIHQSDRQLNKGCLLLHTIIELRDVDRELSQKAADFFEEIENAFTACFQKSQKRNTLTVDTDPGDLSAFIMTLIKGLRVTARQGAESKYLNSIINTALKIFRQD